MRPFKRGITVLLCLLLLTAGSVAALAEGSEDGVTKYVGEHPKAPMKKTVFEPDRGYASKGETSGREKAAAGYTPEEELGLLTELCDRIRAGLLDGEQYVSVDDLSLPVGSAQVKHIGFYCPYFDGTNISARLLYYYGSDVCSRIQLTNSLGTDETAAWIRRVDAALDELDRVADVSLAPADRVLRLHDYMCANYHYDTSFNEYYPGVLLTEGLGVCQSYAYLFQYVMLRQGIVCYALESDSMNHAWNMVQLNGSYYHLDVTWDDPVNDDFGLASHDFFLLTDATISDGEHDHAGWDLTQFTCDDDSFESAYMTEAQSPVAFVGGDRYYCGILDGRAGLICCHADTGIREMAVRLDFWRVFGGSGYYGGRCWSGLFEYEGLLYFNSYYAILTYHPGTGKTCVYRDVDTAEGYIFGMVGQDGYLTWSCQQTVSVEYADKDLRTIELTPVTGDVDGDGGPDLKDVSLLFRYVTGKTELTAKALTAADVDHSGAVVLTDVAILYRVYADCTDE